METILRIRQLLPVLLSSFLIAPAAVATTEPPSDPAQLLQWVADPRLKNVCQGYYKEAAVLLDYPPTTPADNNEISSKSRSQSLSLNDNNTILIGDVVITQTGRTLKADKATLYYDPDTGKITHVVFNGNVSLREAGKFIASAQATLYPEEKRAILENATYRVTNKTETNGILNIWGTSSTAEREPSGILHFTQASYTTCSPANRTWQVEGSDVRIDKKGGWAEIKNAKLRFKNLPIFYFPYLTFPIDDARKTGFLMPLYGYSSMGGLDLSFPFYWNIAPNYDATITPRLVSKRGMELSTLFRYLTNTSNGSISGSILPNDNAFADFRNSAASQFASTPNAEPYINELNHDDKNRYGFAIINNTTFNPNWSTSLNVNYVSDSYYFLDLGNDFNAINVDQLLNQLDLNYKDEHWNFLARLQAYQTLHAITQSFVADQYARTPELDLSGDFANQPYGLHYQFNSQFVRFDHPKDFLTGLSIITGNRWHIQPQVSLPLHFSDNSYFTPAVAVDATHYTLQNMNTPFAGTINRVLPIISISSGLFFERAIHFLHTAYLQTLEPEIFYLYVPNKNQSDIPLFDTVLPPFTFAQLFTPNRFAGYDRLGDANQLTVAATSRFLDANTGEQKLRMSLGQIFYIQKHHVCLYPGCVGDPTIDDNVSPIVGELSYNLSSIWSATATLAWDTEQVRVNNSGVGLHYQSDKSHIFNIDYEFAREGEISTIPTVQPISPINENNNNLNRLDTSFAWPLPYFDNVSSVGAYSYDLANGRTQALVGGLQFDSCCWALRLIASRIYIGQNSSGTSQFDNAYYLQFSFKGFTNVGNADPSTLLQNAIEGYNDYF